MSLAGWIFAYWVLGLWLNARVLPGVLAEHPRLYPANTGERISMVVLIALGSWLWPLGRISVTPRK